MTDLAVVNRATGEVVDPELGAVVNGLLAAAAAGSDGGGCLLASPEGRLSFGLLDSRIDRDVPVEVLPSEITCESLESIAMSVVAPAGAFIAAEISPLVPVSRRGIDLQEEDLAVGDAMPYLEAAAQRPHTRLTRLALVAPVGRARRLDARAPARLASHSEDWGRVTSSGVQPRRVLASEIHEQTDIYENAVLVQSLVEAHRYISRRHDRTKELQSFYGVLGQMLSNVEGHWRAAERLYELIGVAFRSHDEALAMEIEAELAALLRKVGGAMATPVVREAKPLGTKPLHVTNLLTDDARYRSAYRLLLQLRQAQREGAPAVDEDARSAGLAHDHAAFCVLLVLRALRSIDERSGRQISSPAPGGRTEVGEHWVVEWTDLHVVRVQHAGGLELTVVPVQHALDADDSGEALSHGACQMVCVEAPHPVR